MAHPQIAAFARLASGGAEPTRVIAGQRTNLCRTMHDIRYDEVNDEFLVTQPYAHAILAFRGGASGEEAPLRAIQGSRTQLGAVDRLDVDAVHDEIFVPDDDEILVFARKAQGDVAPIRVIHGADTQLRNATTLSVDPVNDVLVVGLNKTGEGTQPNGALLIFNRTDNGNVKPRVVIRGSKTGITRITQMALYPPRRLIVATQPGEVREMEPEDVFVGVWSYDDSGDVPARLKLHGPKSQLKKPRGIVLDPKHREMIIADMRLNAVLTYSFPEIF